MLHRAGELTAVWIPDEALAGRTLIVNYTFD